MERLSTNLRTLRKSSGLTLEKLIEMLGISSRQSIYDWESGRSLPPIDRLVKLAEMYNVSVDHMLYHDFEGMGTVNESEYQYGTNFNVVVLNVSPQSELMLSPTIPLDRQGNRIYIPSLPSSEEPWYLIIASGGAMSPTINPGDSLLCRASKIANYQQDEPHVIVQQNNAVIIRRIRPIGEGRHSLHADNKIVTDSMILTDDVNQIFRVVYRLDLVTI